jgi:hypothetical protein
LKIFTIKLNLVVVSCAYLESSNQKTNLS